MINISATSKCLHFHYLQICFVCWPQKRRFCSIARLLLFCFNCILMFHDWGGAQINQKNFSSTSLYKPLSLPFIHFFDLTHSGLLSLSSASCPYNKHFFFMLQLPILHMYLDEGGIVVWALLNWSIWEIVRNSPAQKLGKCLLYFSKVFARGGERESG